MSSNFGNAVDGLRARLEAGVSGLKCYPWPPDSINHYPCALIIPEPLDVALAFAGNTFETTFRVKVFLSSGEASEGFLQLYDYIDPTAANKSLIAAVRADPTLGGKVDSCDVTRIENIGRQEQYGGIYGFDMLVNIIKTVA